MILAYLMVDGFVGQSQNPKYPDSFELLSYASGPRPSAYAKGNVMRPEDQPGGNLHFVTDTFMDSSGHQWMNARWDGTVTQKIIKTMILVAIKSGEESRKVEMRKNQGGSIDLVDDYSKESEILRMKFTDAFVLTVEYAESYRQAGFDKRHFVNLVTVDYANHETAYGLVPQLHETVQPKHRHLIDRLKFLTQHRLVKPGGRA